MCYSCSNSDERFADIALREARKSPVQFRHGCVAVIGGKIIERGYNSYQTYSKDGLIGTSCSCHAEISVLRKCLRRNIKGKMNLYIVRLSNTSNDMLSSSPCKECYETMRQFNIRYIIYSDNSNILIKQKFNEFEPYHETSGKRAIIEKRVKRLGNI